MSTTAILEWPEDRRHRNYRSLGGTMKEQSIGRWLFRLAMLIGFLLVNAHINHWWPFA
jgi:hypothetical protein